MMYSTGETYWRIYARLVSGAPFAYTRFGDGELDLMEGGVAAGQPYHPELAADVAFLLDIDDDRTVMNALATHLPEPDMRPGLFLGWSDPKYDKYKRGSYDNAIALHYYAVFKPLLLRKLFDKTRERPKVFVGANGGPKLERLIGEYHEVWTPYQDAYSVIDDWYPKVEAAARETGLVFVAAGAAKCSMVRRLLAAQVPVQIIDLGSLVDYANGIPTRTWIEIALKEHLDARKALIG